MCVFFKISAIPIVESIQGISNPLLSGNIKIYDTDLTILTGIYARCQPSVCTIVFKCFPKFLINVKCILCLGGMPAAPVGTKCSISVHDKGGATREYGRDLMNHKGTSFIK